MALVPCSYHVAIFGAWWSVPLFQNFHQANAFHTFLESWLQPSRSTADHSTRLYVLSHHPGLRYSYARTATFPHLRPTCTSTFRTILRDLGTSLVIMVEGNDSEGSWLVVAMEFPQTQSSSHVKDDHENAWGEYGRRSGMMIAATNFRRDVASQCRCCVKYRTQRCSP